MLALISIITFLFSFTVISLLFLYLGRDKINLRNRIEKIKSDINVNEIDGKSFLERAVFPLYSFLYNFFMKFTPQYKMQRLTKKIELAGYSKNDLGKWIFTKAVATSISFLLSFIIFDLISKSILKSLILALLVAFLTSFIYNFNLSKKIYRRKKNILRDLPYVLDLITVSVEAGLSFDGALAKVTENISGELSDEFAKTLKEIRMGIQRKVALRNLSERCEVKELSTFVTSLIQADELGVSLGKVLRIEAANLREQRKQAARESAMKAPIKMLFPLVFFIFPTIFIVILGPALIKIYNFFLR
ncbi:type II secretion system F family protein [Thermobrachium celere]|uniref:Type II/IV secretion system protein TadC, associated with Flp pilus assembly n=1 Tax=Thermobrachium celere DSM 8682 TaxID=941824 RepID=R7RRR7_9CLOT|nr:type II secretion system F family protein [Thermobrachium celere]CDF58754.1 Type II/IV secretion system protein TadC, associated with Flp pilus assembly [Thermobrachium celere DSM 8682]